MANIQAQQAFYSLTLEPSSAPIAACMCNVIPGLKPSDQQVFEARGSKVYLRRLEVNKETGDVTMETMLERDTFSTVRGVGTFKLPGLKLGKLAPTVFDALRCIVMELFPL